MNTCPISGKRHAWTWIKNRANKSVTISSRGTRVHLSLKGLYRCECGEKKEGRPHNDGPDLGQLVGGVT